MSNEIEEYDPRIERIIWKGLGTKTVRQMAEETGLSPEKIHAIKREMLSAVDVLTIQEKRQKLLIDLEDIADNVRSDYDSAPFEFKAGLMNSAVSAMKTILVELNRTAKGEQEAIDRLNALRVKELVNLVREAVDTSVPEISEKYNIPEDDLFDIFNANLGKAAMKREIE